MFRYSSTITWQEQPFPDDKRRVPDFARQQRDVPILPGSPLPSRPHSTLAARMAILI